MPISRKADKQQRTTMSDWKDRFNEKQLERKRLSDKISQRRIRQQSKRNMAELECRLRLLLDGDTSSLINRIQQENALLRTKIWRYRSRMESMFVQGKECLQQDDSSWKTLTAPIVTRPPGEPDLDEKQSQPHVVSPSDSDCSHDHHPAEQRCMAKLFKIQPSFFVELATLIGRTNTMHSQLEANEILESIMMWRAKFGLITNEFTVLLVSLGLDQEPFYLTPEKVKEQALSKYLFQDIIQNLIYGEEPSPRDLQADDKIPEEQMSKMQHQRRAIAYCAYETVRAWRDCFKSSLEYVAIFWAQYKYFMIIAFPTRENFFKCPAWRRPIAEQFDHDHPSIIDLIVWPKLRERLVSTWHQYELPSLCVSIVRSLEFKGVQTDIANVIRLQSDSSDVLLDESFEREIHDIRNFIASSAPFTAQYPELAAAITVELILFPYLTDSQQEQSRKESLEHLENQTLMSGCTSQCMVLQTTLDASSGQQSELGLALDTVIDADPLDLVADSSTNISGSLDWWTESHLDQGFQAISRELGEKWDLESSFPDFLPFSNTVEVDITAHDLQFNTDSMMTTLECE